MLKHSLPILSSLLLAGGLAAQGGLLGTFASPAPGPVSIGVIPTSGNLLVIVSGNTVYEVTITGGVVGSWSAATNSGIANGITSDGTNIFIADGSRSTGGRGIDVYDMQGNYQSTFPSAAFAPAGVCFVAQTNHLILVDSIGSAAIEYDMQGNQVTSTTLVSRHDGIAHDPVSNTFWAYDTTNDLIVNYDPAFNAISSFTGPTGVLGAPGRGLTYIGGIAYATVQSQDLIALFDTTGTSAGVATYGTGCPTRGIFYEEFGAGAGDLAGIGFHFQSRNGNSWRAVGGATWETNVGPNLNLADDQIVRAQALGFSWPVPGGTPATTTAIDISSNGWVGLMANEIPDSGFYNGNAARATDLPKYQRIGCWWDDLDPSVAGSVHFNTLTNPNRAIVTWDQVPSFGLNDSNSVQLQLYGNGDFKLIWQAGCGDDGFVGYSGGGDPADPGSIDLTLVLPTTFGPYGAPLELDSGRPVLGTTVNYTVTNIPSSGVIGGIIFGLQQTATPLDAVGMPGCTLLSSGDLFTATLNLSTGVYAFPIPNQTSVIGVTMYHQAVIIAPGINPFGAIASNGLELILGT